MLQPIAYLGRQGSGRFRHITREEAEALARAAKRFKTQLMIKLLWETGVRISELLDIHVEDIDFDKAEILIRRRKRRRPFSQTLPISRALCDELRLYTRLQRRHGRLFKGTRVTAWRALRDLGIKVLGRPVNPHAFRHGRAYELVQRGINPLLLARVLGHASVINVISYYHPTNEDLRMAMGV